MNSPSQHHSAFSLIPSQAFSPFPLRDTLCCLCFRLRSRTSLVIDLITGSPPFPPPFQISKAQFNPWLGAKDPVFHLAQPKIDKIK